MLQEARARLSALPQSRLTAASTVFVTAPVGGPEQQEFYNQVVELATTLSVHRLLREILAIEAALGRERREPWGPRTIDVDILWYHGLSVDEEGLVVPHPRMQERRFVLEPLSELAPDLVLEDGKTVAEALRTVQDQQVEPLRPPRSGKPE